ncbi:MAG: glycosyltransferase [Candidatus Abawacabacteria bacterium]|nr:glycosyltransferase [Candidatus Abawacabacteria bacterium]
MRIGINLTHLNPGVNGGIEHCIRAWLHYFPIIASQHTYVVFAHRKVLDTLDAIEKYEIVEVPYWLENLPAVTASLGKLIPERGIDVWWSPLMILDPLNLSIPSAFVLADLQHEYYPNFFSPEELSWRRKQIAFSAEHADLVITISEDAKKDIVNFLKIPADKVSVAYLDSEPWFKEDLIKAKKSLVREKYHLPPRFLFYPANTWPHKNHINLLKAFNLLKKVYSDLSLVFTGAASNAHADIQSFIDSHGLSEKVHYLGHIAREDMPYIYSNAEMLVFPSLFEGFGIPLVEAMRSGCPIVASSVTSVPEIAKDAALYVDPKNPLDIAEKISRLLDNASLKHALLSNAAVQVKNFSYEQSAKTIIQNLEKIATVHWHGKENATLTSTAEMPLVSIITPSYNQGEFIEETIKSVMEQTYKNIEYIIVDGGSKDNTVEIITKMVAQYPNRIQWISEKDKGQSDAINKGLRRARGDIVAWLNSDDIYDLATVEKVVSFFKSNKAISFVHGQGLHIAKDGTFLELYPSKPCDYNTLHYSCPICQPTSFWRRDILLTVGYLNPTLHFAMDYEYWIRISKQFKMGFIPDHLASTRIYEATKTSNQRHKVHREILEVVKSNYCSVHANWIYAYAHTYPAIANNDRKSFLKNLIFVHALIWYSSINFLRYNHSIPLSSVKLFLGWLWAAFTKRK